MSMKRLTGSKLNAARTIVLHGPMSSGKSTTIEKVRESSPSGVLTFDLDELDGVAADRLDAFAAWVDENGSKKFPYAIISAGDLSKDVVEALPLAKHLFISPGIEEVVARNNAREDEPAKAERDAASEYEQMLADPLFTGMTVTDDAITWLTEYTSALPADAGRKPLSESEMKALIEEDNASAPLAGQLSDADIAWEASQIEVL